MLGLPDIYKIAPHGYNKTALEVRDCYEKTLKIHEIDVNIEDLRKLNWILSYPRK